jgi:hypothetical protein
MTTNQAGSATALTIVLTPSEFEHVCDYGESTLHELMAAGVIRPGATRSDDPRILRDIATLGVQEMIASWVFRQAQCAQASDDLDDDPF